MCVSILPGKIDTNPSSSGSGYVADKDHWAQPPSDKGIVIKGIFAMPTARADSV
jgi:hypothetical protein